MIAAVPLWTLGVPELLIILALVLILFGVGKLPSVLKSMGQGVREFRNASEGDEEDDKKIDKKEEEVEKSL
ncbi:MAG TPA: twin-arginine translocase TatA/TatE family subunit [Myxococcota bacterium]|nr:twin-arginine translocase TatA/TatE family subunit [Myxococcota bacterium]